jgi:hypothetical protein
LGKTMRNAQTIGKGIGIIKFWGFWEVNFNHTHKTNE